MTNVADNIREECQKRINILRDINKRKENNIKFNESYIKSVGLESLIEKAYLSEKDIGDLAGVSAQAVNKWFHIHKKQYPSMSAFAALSKAFTVPIEWIAGSSDSLSIELEKDHVVFSKYGFSPEAFNNIATLKDTYSEFMFEDLMMGLNKSLELKLVKEEKIVLPILVGLKDYLDLDAQKPSLKVSLSDLESVRDVCDISDSIISDYLDEDFEKPYTEEEVKKYISWFNELNFYGNEEKGLKYETFNPDGDKEFSEFIKRIRSQAAIYKYILALSPKLDIQDYDSEPLFYLKKVMRKIKVRRIEEQIKDFTEYAKKLLEDGKKGQAMDYISEIDFRKELLELYRKDI